MNFQSLFDKQKARSFELRRSTAADRIAKLKKLLHALWGREEEILEATRQDFGKPHVETLVSELLIVSSEIHHAIRHLEEWMRPKRVPTGLLLFGARSEVHFDPRGVCLIISPWNYPWQLSLGPIVAALAAGNTMIVKPSELTPRCSELLRNLLRSIFPEEEIAVALGDKDVSTKLLELPFDHIFFTGSTAVGKVVMAAAAKTLATVTLELGGKSPVIVHESADLDWAAERLVWGKWLNAGQTCVAPDTLYVSRGAWPSLLEKIKVQSERIAPRVAEDLSAIISPRHLQRLRELSEQAKARGWKLVHEIPTPKDSAQWPLQFFERADARLAAETGLAREEIFGPLLPVLLFDDLNEVLRELEREDKPLALYLFTRDSAVERRVLRETTSGGVVVNDVMVHLANSHLPFGGVNSSGHGSYHGEFGFRAFSHEKSVLKQGRFRAALRFFQPPYSSEKKEWVRRLIRLGL